MLTGCAAKAPAQENGSPTRSTFSGVFTAAQAAEGGELYAGLCRACHTPSAHAGTFKETWNGQALSEPFGYLLENMPKDSPGTLSPEEVAMLLAYFLQLLGMPAGQQELPADASAVTHIVIDPVAQPSTNAAEERKP
jgi:mono/diheme cytochrome c family protein